MNAVTTPAGDVRHPYGLPLGTVRGFISVLICSFFWVILLMPGGPDRAPPTAPLAHFFLLTLVFLAFASHPRPADEAPPMLPRLMRVLFVGGSVAVVGFVAYQDPGRLAARLTPDVGEIGRWPAAWRRLAGGFAVGLFTRFLLHRRASDLFETARAWAGVVAILLLIAETVFEFLVRPALSAPPDPAATRAWEATLVAVVAAYFGTRA